MKNIFTSNKTYIKLFFVIIASYVCISIIQNIFSNESIFQTIYKIIAPFLFAFIIAYILNPIVNLFNKKLKINRYLSIAITYVLFLSVIAIILMILIPKIYTSSIEVIHNIPNIENYFRNMFGYSNSQHNGYSNILVSVKNNLPTLSSKLNSISGILISGAISFTSSLIHLLFGFLISIYVLIDKDRFLTFSKKLTFIILGKRFGREAIYFVKTVHYMIGSYIGIKAIDSAIIACMAFVGLSLLGSHYVLLITAIVGVANMIPYFGPFIGMVSGALINLFFDPIQAIIIFLYILALQQFDGWFLEPKLIGNRLGLRPFLVILGVIIGGSLYGPIGMLLGSPIMAVIKIYTIRFLNKFKYKYEDEV